MWAWALPRVGECLSFCTTESSYTNISDLMRSHQILREGFLPELYTLQGTNYMYAAMALHDGLHSAFTWAQDCEHGASKNFACVLTLTNRMQGWRNCSHRLCQQWLSGCERC